MAAKKKNSAKKALEEAPSSTQAPPPTEHPQGIEGSGFSLRDELVEEALITGEYRDLLEDYFGEDVYEELRELATRSRRVQVRGGPRVLVLPGIMGSKLGKRRGIFNDTIWLDPIEVVAGHLTELQLKAGNSGIEPIGVLLITYLKLKLRLRLAGFDAAFHPYDWRRGIRDLGAELAERITRETKREGAIVPLYLVAHSMGGLVSRAALKVIAERGDGASISRIVLLGTPNYGSFSPVQALSGYHALVRKLAALDLKHSEKDLINDIFSTFTGLYQMLPAPDRFTDMDLYRLENWPPTGMAPRQDLLEAAPAIHKQLASNDERFVLIAGINKDTVVGVHRTGDSFVFTQSLEGDGTVPLALAQLDGIKTYFIEEDHGSLPNNGEVAKAVVDVLETGATNVLMTTWTPKRRGASWDIPGEQLTPVPFGKRTGKDINRRELRHLLEEFAAPAASGREAIAPAAAVSAPSEEPIVIARKRQGRIDLRLARGSITQVDTRAVVLGLFNGVKPAGPASAIDEQLDGAISDFTERRMLSANAGEVFIMPANRYRTGADMVVFAGLGSYDDFSEEILRVVGENVARVLVRTRVDEFATVMMGSKSGLTLEAVLKNLIQGFIRGVHDANARSWLRAVTFCEQDQHRFEQLHREILHLSSSSLFDDMEVTVEALGLPAPPPPTMPVRRPTGGPTPVYLLVREIPERTTEITDTSLSASFALRASLLTAGSKATVITDSIEINATQLNGHLEKIETQAFDFDNLEAFGSALADMVLPTLVRRALREMQEYQLVVINDARTSRIPWETINIDHWFPAATTGMSHKYEAEDLTVAKWLEERRLDRDLNVLLVVNPTGDLAGAEAEGKRIKNILKHQPNVQVGELWRDQATFNAIRAAFRSGEFDVVHYAGHAFFDPLNRARSGIICHGHQILSGLDLVRLERLPALMFFNACESGRLRRAPLRVWSQADRKEGECTAKRLETNVGFAEALLRAGVGNYIGTYWPVGDESAKAFSETFYQRLVSGASLGAAIDEGRQRVWDLRSEDWADYILYGSPDFAVKRRE